MTQRKASRSSRSNECNCDTCKEKKRTEKKSYSRTKFRNFQKHLQHHTDVLGLDALKLLFTKVESLNIRKLIDFWTDPLHIRRARGKLASTISRSSWYLAVHYLSVGNLEDAKAFILNGSFLLQCSHTPIEELARLCKNTSRPPDIILKARMPYFRDGFLATKDLSSMKIFLEKAMPSDYKEMMGSGSEESMGPITECFDVINENWNETSSSALPKGKSNAETKKSKDGETESKIDIIILNDDTQQQSKINFGLSTTMKTLFTDYAAGQDVSLRSLRFTYQGRILFLSSVSSKTPSELGIKNLDVINVSNIEAAFAPRKETSHSQSNMNGDIIKSLSKRSVKKSKKKKKKSKSPLLATSNSEENNKICHSQALSLLFEEAGPKFKEIRQRLNAINIERTEPKQKTKQNESKSNFGGTGIVYNPSTDEMGGKAGKTRHIIQVGEVGNLYKTTKPSSVRKKGSFSNSLSQATTLDLHGFTKEEALQKLNQELPKWVDIAMHGPYPWVIPVLVICGGGNQILSEAVGNWIQQNEKVSNAPKNLFLHF